MWWVCPSCCFYWKDRFLPGAKVSPRLHKWIWCRWVRQTLPLWNGWCSKQGNWRLLPPVQCRGKPSTGRCRSSATDTTSRTPCMEINDESKCDYLLLGMRRIGESPHHNWHWKLRECITKWADQIAENLNPKWCRVHLKQIMESFGSLFELWRHSLRVYRTCRI